MWQNQKQQQGQQPHYYYSIPPDPQQQQAYYGGQQQPPYPQQGYNPSHSQQQQPYYPPPQQQQVYNPPQQQFNVQQQQAPYADPEDPEAKGFEFNDQAIRKGFIRKVFSILTVQLLVTIGFVCLFIFHRPTQLFVIEHFWLWIVSVVILFVTMIILACCESVRRKTPANFILLGVFTLAMSFMMGVMSANFEVFEVLMALGITAVVTISLVIFAFQTKWDFTTMGGVLFVAVIILFILGMFAIFMPGRTLMLVYASLGALIFCIYLVYDIQMMMGGKHKYSISPEEYIFAALNLYLDIVNIFMYILMLIGASRS